MQGCDVFKFANKEEVEIIAISNIYPEDLKEKRIGIIYSGKELEDDIYIDNHLCVLLNINDMVSEYDSYSYHKYLDFLCVLFSEDNVYFNEKWISLKEERNAFVHVESYYSCLNIIRSHLDHIEDFEYSIVKLPHAKEVIIFIHYLSDILDNWDIKLNTKDYDVIHLLDISKDIHDTIFDYIHGRIVKEYSLLYGQKPENYALKRASMVQRLPILFADVIND